MGRVKWLVLLSFTALMGCAGPMTPFGPLNRLMGRDAWKGRSAGPPSPARIHFFPERQVLHAFGPLQAVIEDPAGVTEDSKVSVYYNGLDVTADLPPVNRAPSSQGRELRVNLGSLRLPPGREHQLVVVYQHAPDVEEVTATLLPPRCAYFDFQRSLRLIPDFDPPAILIRTINDSARSAKLNPNLIGGLIAQESGFDPEAVSSSKALGLTQLTALGEAEVVKTYQQWPRYPGLNEMSWPFVKLGILRGHIHGQNEWRLDPRKSIQGGVAYLNQIQEYWRRPEKRELLKRHLPGARALGELLLASYNSGPTRVAQVLERRGSEYLHDGELTEALKYVRKVTSYCDYYAQLEN
jgi:hypothetical protein